jgi:hypothetical protein
MFDAELSPGVQMIRAAEWCLGAMARTSRLVKAADENQDWKEGLGFFIKAPGLILEVVTGSSGTAIIEKIGSREGAITCAAVTLFGFLMLMWLRAYRIRVLKTGIRLHDLCHKMRDLTIEIRSLARVGDVGRYKQSFDNFPQEVCKGIANFFGAMLKRDSIGCAIRLADADETGTQVYRTVGRANMREGRKQGSEPISSEEGIARRIRQEPNCQGVHIIPTIADAKAKGWWKECPNDGLPDIKSLMVAPINGKIRDERSMIGILYVTCSCDVFRNRHVEPMMAFADLLGMVYPSIIFRKE